MFLSLDKALHTEVLRHSVRLQGKGIELVGIDGELLLDRSERLKVDEEKDLVTTLGK